MSCLKEVILMGILKYVKLNDNKSTIHISMCGTVKVMFYRMF